MATKKKPEKQPTSPRKKSAPKRTLILKATTDTRWEEVAEANNAAEAREWIRLHGLDQSRYMIVTEIQTLRVTQHTVIERSLVAEAGDGGNEIEPDPDDFELPETTTVEE